MNKALIGERIRIARENKKLTQEKLAECIGISTTSLSNIEQGKTSPNLKNMIAIAKVLDISIDALLSEESKTDEMYIHEINLMLNDMEEWKLEHISKYVQLMKDAEIDTMK